MGAIARLVLEYSSEAVPTYGNIWIATPYFPGRLFFFTVADDEDFALEKHFDEVYDILRCPYSECLWGVFNGVIAEAQPFPGGA